MQALDFFTGSRETLALPMVDSASGEQLQLDGAVVVLQLRWPDDPSIARQRYEWLAFLELLEREFYLPDGTVRPEVSPQRLASVLAQRDEALRCYAAAAVASWNVAQAPCTIESVLALFARWPAALLLVVDALGDADRFLPASLRTSQPEPALESEARS